MALLHSSFRRTGLPDQEFSPIPQAFSTTTTDTSPSAEQSCAALSTWIELEALLPRRRRPRSRLAFTPSTGGRRRGLLKMRKGEERALTRIPARFDEPFLRPGSALARG